ncbi:hypothetical protein NQZ68_016219 [Dissostichus eleginoides]|nr:hypothetical protein NQZ68_016219 [Dissostichus eleginoides]
MTAGSFQGQGPPLWAIDAVQTPIKRSLPALNLPAVLPRALEMEKGRLGVTMLRVLIQRTPLLFFFSLPTSPVSVQTPFTTARVSLRASPGLCASEGERSPLSIPRDRKNKTASPLKILTVTVEKGGPHVLYYQSKEAVA